MIYQKPAILDSREIDCNEAGCPHGDPCAASWDRTLAQAHLAALAEACVELELTP